ncbi:MAG: response regulator transcription factor [Deltaproteobacteria bacterium]|nr:response regulator transcription factor [Candidatus Tharpella aukensis]
MASFAEFSVHDWVAYVVGRHNTERGLLASFLEREFGFFCQVAENEYDRPTSKMVGDHRLLLLRDCTGDDATSITSYLDAFGNSLLGNDKIYVALINLDPGFNVEDSMLRLGVRGVIDAKVTSKLLNRFIRAIIGGELWFPRHLVSRCILESRVQSFNDDDVIDNNNNNPSKPLLSVTLSDREREVLKEIGIGSTNDQIADHLYISRHTVKSHVYRIFKKINVPNRLQAALWASKYLA